MENFLRRAELRKVNFTDKQLFIEYLTSRLGLFTDSYKDTPIIKIQFDYIAKEGLADDKRLILNSEDYQVASYSYNKLNLPLTMDPYKFGEVFAVQESEGKTKYAITNGSKTIHITQELGPTIKDKFLGKLVEYKARVNTVHYTSPIDLTFVDTQVSFDIFKREISKDTLYIQFEKVIVSEKQLPAKPFSAGRVEKDLAGLDIFSTIDIETVLINGVQTPYLICGYDSGQKFSCYASDLSEGSINKMFQDFISQLLDRCTTAKTKFV